ncbi:hypothetical protein MFLAVUS_008021 [Mucor flavus]|uniref:Uncharacterized protein n=1 Tax=Mucor flavus TaxID=439312 RepID=A0ABP9Z611_9FUNG
MLRLRYLFVERLGVETRCSLKYTAPRLVKEYILSVEPELRDSSEDMPEFIVKWNSNKRKRFRPVTPSTSRSPKKRRTGVTEFKPRVT